MLLRTSNIAKIYGPVNFFLLYELECNFFFLIDVDIQLILEFRNSFGKYHPVSLKNPERAFFWDTLYLKGLIG